MSAMGRVLFHNPSLIIRTPVVKACWLFHSCCMVMWLASWPNLPVTARYLGKVQCCLVSSWSCGKPLDGNRDGCSVEAGPLDAHSILPHSEQWCRMHEVSCYHGPHIGCQFLSWVHFVFLTLPFCGNLTSALGPWNWRHQHFLMLLDIIIYLILWLWRFSTIKGDI